MTRFVTLEKPEPEADLGPELGIFDRYGMLAASYRTRRRVVHVWIYRPDSANDPRFLIIDTEARARAICEAIAEQRSGGALRRDSPPDLDDMYRDLTSSR